MPVKTRFAREQIVIVRGGPRARSQGMVALGGAQLRCALGRSGRLARKREGDGGTPIGCWRIEWVGYRPDRVARPRTGLPVRAIRRHDGWCDAPADRNYNRLVRHPYPASAEQLWRADHLYDLVVVLQHNRRPRIRGLGSAIFMHVARRDYSPTAGCIALARRDLQRLIERLRPGAAVHIMQ